jgi:cell division protein FtsB
VKGRALAVGLGGLLALGLIVYGGSSMLRVLDMTRDIERLEQQIHGLRLETQQLTRTIEQLRHDPAEIERLAREQLGFVRDGERVLKLPPSPAIAPPRRDRTTP